MKAEIEILQIRDGKALRKRDVVASEIPLTVFLNDTEVATLLTSNSECKSLAVGFLFAEGFLQGKDELSGVFESTERKVVRVYTEDKREPDTSKGVITTGCGGGRSYAHYDLEALEIEPMEDTLQVSSEVISELMHRLQTQSVLFRETGGVHSCALAQGDRIVLMKEDIGRHNAMDRILGMCLLEDIPLEDKIMLTSGRASSEIVFKAGRGRIPILVSRSAPTDLAIRIAEQAGITLVGFVRGRRMNVYAHSERIDYEL
jgi:FdhD protein